MSSIVMHAVCRQERRRNFVHQQGKADLLKNKLQIFKISKKRLIITHLEHVLISLLCALLFQPGSGLQ